MDAGKIIDIACRPWPNTRAVQAERILARAQARDLSLVLQSRASNARGVWSLIADPTALQVARDFFHAALSINPTFQPAAENLTTIAHENPRPDPPVRIAIVTLSSPSSHFVDPWRWLDLTRVLRRAANDVTAIVVRFDNALELNLEIPHQVIDLKRSVCEAAFQAGLADPLRRLNPDLVLLRAPPVDLPDLAAAVCEFPYVLGPEAIDLCRLLENASAQAHELSDESALNCPGPGTIAFDDRMRQAIWDAEEVLVSTPEAQGRLAPHARSVRVVPWGVDPAVFYAAARESTSNSLRLCVVLTRAACEEEVRKSVLRPLAANPALASNRLAVDVLGPSDLPSPIATDPHDRARRFQNADIVIFIEESPQSEWAALLAESMACGRPIVAPRNQSTQYFLSDGIDGMLFEPGIPRDLPRAVHQLASDERLRHEIGANAGRTALRRFDWKVLVERAYRPIFRRKTVADFAPT